MHLDHKKYGLSISILEQLSFNGGSFLFFLISARFIGPEKFGLFSILWAGVQIIISISTPWIVLPITSTSKLIDFGVLFKSSIIKILLTSLITPFLIVIYYNVFFDSYNISEILLMSFLGIGIVLFDFFRFVLVREGKIFISFIFNAIRWLFTLFSFLLMFFCLEIKSIHLVISLIIGIFLGNVFHFTQVKSFFFKELKKDSKVSGEKLQYQLFHLGISNLGNSTIMTFVLSKLDVMLLGSIQAFRSFLNIVPFMLQYFETHYSSRLLKKHKIHFISRKFIYAYGFFSVFIIIGFTLFAKPIISSIFGYNYVSYWYAFPLILSLTLIQSLSRIVNVQNRINGILNVFNYSAIVLWISSLFYVLIFVNNIMTKNLIMVLMVLTAFSQLLIYLTQYKSKKNSK